MDSFIVRFYRRTPRAPQEVVGTVERIGSGERSAFAGHDELLERLLAPPDRAPPEEPDPLPGSDEASKR
jgi:hypothetical protein